MSANRLLLADRRGTVTPRAWGGAVVRPFRFKTIGRLVQAGESEEAGPVVMDNTALVTPMRNGGASTDRLVAALVIMIQQGHRNRPDGAGTLAPSKELRTA